MKKLLTIVSLSLSLMIFAASCSSDATSYTAEIRAEGSYVKATSRSLEASPPGEFASGVVSVNGNAVELKPVNIQNQMSSNNVEFAGTVTDVPEKITLSVSPYEGFIFDEWKLDKFKLKQDNVNLRKIRELESILEDDADENENLIVNAEDAKYFIATFDRGYYLDFSSSEKGNGTKEKPFNSFTEADIKDIDQDELTLKLAGSSPYSFESLLLPKAVEEFKIIGGFDSSNWTSSNSSRSTITSLPANLSNVELELRNISITNIDASNIPEDSEFSNVEVENLFVNNQVVANIIANNVSGSGIFVNSVIRNYVDESTYYHSIIYNAVGKTINGENNILVYESGDEPAFDGMNIWVKSSDLDSNNPYLLSNPESIVNLKNASPVRNKSDLIEDYLEEDILSRDRAEEDDYGFKVSYGPYEYNEYLDN